MDHSSNMIYPPFVITLFTSASPLNLGCDDIGKETFKNKEYICSPRLTARFPRGERTPLRTNIWVHFKSI